MINDAKKKTLEEINSNKPEYGLVDDLDINLYDRHQLKYVSKGRGDDFDYGNIDDLDPMKYTWQQMLWISMGRGNSPLG